MTIEMMLFVSLMALLAVGLASLVFRIRRRKPFESVLGDARWIGGILTGEGPAARAGRIEPRPRADAPRLSVGPVLRRRPGSGGGLSL